MKAIQSDSMKKSLSIVFCAIALVVSDLQVARSDDGAISKAKDDAASYILEVEFGLPQYLMTVSFEAETSPDAPALYNANGSMHKLVCEEGAIEGCKVRSKTIADDRTNDRVPLFFGNSSWEELSYDGKRYSISDSFGKRTADPVLIDRYYEVSHFPNLPKCVNLFDWPLLYCSRLKGTDKKSLAEEKFGGNHVFYSARWLDKETCEACWYVPRGYLVGVATFRQGLPIKHESVWFDKVVDPTKSMPDLRQGMATDKTETKWKKLGETYVPNVVHYTTCENPWKDPSFIDVTAKIDVFDKDSKEFTSAKNELLKLLEVIKKKYEK